MSLLIEIITTGSMLGVLVTSYYYQTNLTDDHKKIEKIAQNVGLFVKEDKGKKTIRLHAKRYDKTTDSMEYVYQIPLGLEFEDFLDKKGKFIDGLNNVSVNRINLNDFKQLKPNKDILKQIQRIIKNRVKLNKEIEMDYDGMLKIIVYNQGLSDRYDLTEEVMNKCKGWEVALGRKLKSKVIHDFEEGPMVLIGGATDMGKSNILNLIITTLINNQPDNVKFTLIDLKGGLEFGTYENLKQVKNFADDVNTAKIALENVQSEMEVKFNMLRSIRKRDIKQAGIKERHFVIIDEAAELASTGEVDPEIKKLKVECEGIIKDLSRRGRASGIRLIYCTQYPTTETVSSQVKRNLITRIALPVDTSTASNVVLDEGGAEKLPLIKGRSIYKRHKCQTMQAYYINDELINKTIGPHINIKPRSEQLEQPTKENGERRKYTTVFEEVGLLDEKPNSNTPRSKK